MRIEDEILQLEVYIGGLYREQMGIFLIEEGDYFKWFLASLFFGARISETCAKRAYAGFVKSNLTSVEKILKADYDFLVKVLDDNSYARYDFKTANKLKETAGNLQNMYGGDILKLFESSTSYENLAGRLKMLAKGIGDTTVNIYLRELRGMMKYADPPISQIAETSADNLRVKGRLETLRVKAPIQLSRVEAILIRLGKYYCKKNRCPVCPARDMCAKFH